MKTSERRTESHKRPNRARPTPRYLLQPNDLDEMAKRRCLMVLDVLSGLRPVTEAIQEAGISRPMYYQLEERALKAMLSALMPGATENGPEPSMTGRISELEERIRKMEKEKRRAERLLLLTRKLVRKGPMKLKAGRPPGSRNRQKSSSPTGSNSTRSGSADSTNSRAKAHPLSPPPSIPMKDGVAAS